MQKRIEKERMVQGGEGKERWVIGETWREEWSREEGRKAGRSGEWVLKGKGGEKSDGEKGRNGRRKEEEVERGLYV